MDKDIFSSLPHNRRILKLFSYCKYANKNLLVNRKQNILKIICFIAVINKNDMVISAGRIIIVCYPKWAWST